MKKLKLILVTALLLTVALPGFASEPKEPRAIPAKETVEVRILVNRLEEIKEMDKSNMDRAEKKELRKEVRGIQKELRALNAGGIYLSVGALILVILLLILLL